MNPCDFIKAFPFTKTFIVETNVPVFKMYYENYCVNSPRLKIKIKALQNCRPEKILLITLPMFPTFANAVI